MDEEQYKPKDVTEGLADEPKTEPPVEQAVDSTETMTSDEMPTTQAAEVTEANDSETEAPKSDGSGEADKPMDTTTDIAATTEKKKRKGGPVWYGIVAAAVLLVGGVAAFLTLSGDSDQPVATEQPVVAVQEKVTTLGATIATIEGDVQFSGDGEIWTDAAGGESLAHLDYIRTLEDSRAIVLFDDGSVARLDGDTELYLSSLEADGLEVTLKDGQVYSRVVESDSQTFTVVTSNERFTALGTAYKTSTDGTKDELEVYQSNVKVESEDVEVPEGNKYDTENKELLAIDLDELKDDEFAQWNKDRDSESDEFKDKLGVLDEKPEEKEETPEPSTSTNEEETKGITLAAKPTDSGVKLTWTLSGVASSNGFKIVRDKSNTKPLYGENDAQYVGVGNRSHQWYDDNGGTYYYRVCIYRESGSCDTYSNSVKATSPKVEKEEVKDGDISLSINGNKISWSLVGGNAPHGFKIVLDKDEDPEYPEHSIVYVGPETKSAVLPEKSAGTYYVRVCKYTNGTQDDGCVDYSNEVEYVVSAS